MQPVSQSQESLALPPARDGALLVVALAGVSASGPIMAATAAPALAIAFWRNALGAASTGVVTGLRQRAEFAALTRRGWTISAVAGVFLALHFGTWVPSVKLTSVASATALVATQSIFSGLFASFAGRVLPRAAWFGMALAILGTAFIAGADFGVSARALTGDGLAVLGGLFAAAYVTAGAGARKLMSAAAYTSICYTVCAFCLLLTCLVGRQSLHGYPARAWLLIIGVTLCAQLLGHSLINVVLRSMSPTLVSLAILVETPGAGLIAAVWLHQTPPIWAFPGLALLFCGLVIVVRARERAPAADLD
ncbi:MAG: DMT family transporter [Actinomycetota bacterium]|nr:DMT family transporter [Actinomycetota bacterium]MDQ2957490.1 DMT family transporter [Actinomycetota bacterium]